MQLLFSLTQAVVCLDKISNDVRNGTMAISMLKTITIFYFKYLFDFYMIYYFYIYIYIKAEI